MDLKKLIFDLCRAQGVSGSERCAAEVAKAYLKPFADIHIDRNGSLIAILGDSNSKRTVLLDAHLDRIGFIVTDIDDDGFVKVDKCGGIDPRTLQDAVLISESGIKGTVCCLPPHLNDGKENKATPITKIRVDFGMGADEIKKYIRPGDMLTFAAEPAELLNGRIASAALDNRCGVAALIRAAELLSGREGVGCKIAVVLSSQEETFGTGAKTSAYKLCADEAIAVDVSFASQPDVSGQYSKIELEKGPMIAIAPVLSREMSDYLIRLAKDKEIPYQLEPIGGRTGTNGDSISVSRGGVRTAVISIPQRYMHTPSEVIALCDVENTARLIVEYIMSGGAFNG